MRTEQEMYKMILDYAQADERVRAVYMNGSRANPNAPKDKYMDFDIVYVVKDLESFKSNINWVDVFGKRLITQLPEAMRYPDGDGSFVWLMLFEDGNRIDLSLIPIEKPELIGNDSATVVLLDKDNILPDYPPNSDKDYIIKQPDELFYTSCCNNFFWCMQNVAKGIARDELPYCLGMYHKYVLPELNDMISWYIGTQNNFSVSSGKLGKYYKKYLSADLYEKYKLIFSNSDYQNIWNSILSACELFRCVAKSVGDYLGYEYNESDDEGIMIYLHRMMKE